MGHHLHRSGGGNDMPIIACSGAIRLILVVIGRCTTDQQWLTQCSQDRKRLRRRMRIARHDRDMDAPQRYCTTTAMISIFKARSKVKPLRGSLLPVALLATWASQRIVYVPYACTLAPGNRGTPT
jgi:hypothetical protein